MLLYVKPLPGLELTRLPFYHRRVLRASDWLSASVWSVSRRRDRFAVLNALKPSAGLEMRGGGPANSSWKARPWKPSGFSRATMHVNPRPARLRRLPGLWYL